MSPRDTGKTGSPFKPYGCTCSSMIVGGVNGPSRSVMTIDKSCPWHHGIAAREKELLDERRHAHDPKVLELCCALVSTGHYHSALTAHVSDDNAKTVVSDAHQILRAIREYKE